MNAVWSLFSDIGLDLAKWKGQNRNKILPKRKAVGALKSFLKADFPLNIDSLDS